MLKSVGNPGIEEAVPGGVGQVTHLSNLVSLLTSGRTR